MSKYDRIEISATMKSAGHTHEKCQPYWASFSEAKNAKPPQSDASKTE